MGKPKSLPARGMSRKIVGGGIRIALWLFVVLIAVSHADVQCEDFLPDWHSSLHACLVPERG